MEHPSTAAASRRLRCVAAALLCLAHLAGLVNAGTNIACTAWRVPAAAKQLTPTAGATVRNYYIFADVVEKWSYTPLGRDQCNDFEFPDPSYGTKTYPKAVFTEYTDDTFTVPKKRPAAEEHLGILGPVIRAEEGDYIQVVLRNNLDFEINLEPSGVLYGEPQAAAPKTTVTYIWAAPASTAACSAPSDYNSKMWHYRSTADPVAHNAAGLFGPIVISKQGALDQVTGRPAGVDREMFIVLLRFDDSLNPLVLGDMPEEALLPHTVNGISYCNLPQFQAAYGERVRWYVMGLGNEDDVHVAHWHGISVAKRSQRTVDSLFIVPGMTYTVDSIADNPGTWLFHCHVNHHLELGMAALYTIAGTPFPTAPGPAAGGKTRTYYIQAEQVEWNYAPTNSSLCADPQTPTAFSSSETIFTETTPSTLGRQVLKAQYIQYTDDTFATPRTRPPAEEHLGLQGPTIYAEVGDLIEVKFRNKIPGHSVSLHPHGVLYAKDSEGAPYNDGTPTTLKADDVVPPNESTVTYRWYVPQRAGPGPNDPSSIMWMYHSHTDEAMDTEAGLFGSIVVTRKGAARPDGTPADVDRNLLLTFSVLDESASFLLARNVETYLTVGNTDGLEARVEAARVPGLPFIPSGIASQTAIVLEALFGTNPNPPSVVEEFLEANRKHSINGYFFCNLPKLTATAGQRTRIYIQGLGDAIDLHSPTLYAASLLEDGLPSQAIRILPGLMTTADIVPALAGSYSLQCSVADHIAAGMRARLTVTGGPNPAAAAALPRARTYYISAEKVVWDFAPLGKDGCSGNPFTPEQETYTKAFVGSRHYKGQYVQYTSATFEAKVPQPPQHGILGPVIAAEAGEVIDVVFRNTLPFKTSLKFLAGLVPVGVVVDGVLQVGPAAATDLLTAGVAPGATVTFRWFVPEASAKGTPRHGLAAYTYLSGVDEISHINAGLVGLALVGTKNRFPVTDTTTATRVPNTDFFYPLLFHIFDENQSPFLDDSIDLAVATSGLDPATVNKDSDDFKEANLKHAVNGRLYCNLDALTMPTGQQGIVVMAGTGTENGMHGPVLEGQEIEEDEDGQLALGLLPAVTRVAVVVGGAPRANWRGYCYVHDHLFAGMVIRLDTTGK